ncbi:MAG TPA: efflux RND transporter periplasmic adaptor subunit, partial [Azospirillum sp.]
MAHHGPTLLILALAASLLAAGCREQVQAVERPVAVRVSAARMEALAAPESYAGTIRARVETDLGFQVAGKIARRLADVGTRVEKGQVVAELDAVDLRLDAEAKEADLRAALAVRDQAEAAERRVAA